MSSGATKLTLYLFLGDADTSCDPDLLSSNHITRIVNCAGGEIPNHFAPGGDLSHLREAGSISYLTFHWPRSGNAVIFDVANSVLDALYTFVEGGAEEGEATLIVSSDGASRAAFAAAVFLMLKHRWTLAQTLEFLRGKRGKHALQPRPGYLRQLTALDASLQRVSRGGRTGWDVKPPGTSSASFTGPLWGRGTTPPSPNVQVVWGAQQVDADEGDEVLVNTHLNAQPPPLGGSSIGRRLSATLGGRGGVRLPPRSPPLLTWLDDVARAARRGTSPTRRRTLERPPTASYNGLTPSPGWVDTLGGSTGRRRSVGKPGALPPHAGAPPSVLKGGAVWKREQERERGGDIRQYPAPRTRQGALDALESALAASFTGTDSGGWTRLSLVETRAGASLRPPASAPLGSSALPRAPPKPAPSSSSLEGWANPVWPGAGVVVVQPPAKTVRPAPRTVLGVVGPVRSGPVLPAFPDALPALSPPLEDGGGGGGRGARRGYAPAPKKSAQGGGTRSLHSSLGLGAGGLGGANYTLQRGRALSASGREW